MNDSVPQGLVTLPMDCPFCGETPTVEPIDWKAEGDAWGGVCCENDDCRVKPQFVNHANIRASGASGSRQQQKIAVREWNSMITDNIPEEMPR